MDPNATLAAIRQLIDTEFRDVENGVAVSRTRLAELAEHFRALDEWLTRGGFAPHAWRLLDVQWRDHDLGPDEARTIPDPLGPPDPAGAHLPEHDDAVPGTRGTPRCAVCGGAHYIEQHGQADA